MLGRWGDAGMRIWRDAGRCRDAEEMRRCSRDEEMLGWGYKDMLGDVEILGRWGDVGEMRCCWVELLGRWDDGEMMRNWEMRKCLGNEILRNEMLESWTAEEMRCWRDYEKWDAGEMRYWEIRCWGYEEILRRWDTGYWMRRWDAGEEILAVEYSR